MRQVIFPTAGLLMVGLILAGCASTERAQLGALLRSGQINAVVAVPESPLDSLLASSAEGRRFETGLGGLADQALNAAVERELANAVQRLEASLREGGYFDAVEAQLRDGLQSLSRVEIGEVSLRPRADGARPRDLVEASDGPAVLALIPQVAVIEDFQALRITVDAALLAQSGTVAGLTGGSGQGALFEQTYVREISLLNDPGELIDNLLRLASNRNAPFQEAFRSGWTAILRDLSTDLENAGNSAIRSVLSSEPDSPPRPPAASAP
jgi:hypothetical protein